MVTVLRNNPVEEQPRSFKRYCRHIVKVRFFLGGGGEEGWGLGGEGYQ